MTYALHLLIYLCVWILLAASLNVVVGFCGLLTLAHAAYFAIGAYVYALATLKLGLSFVPAAILGTAIAGFLSLAVSLPSWRLRGDFFIMATLAAGTLFFRVIHNWSDPGAEVGSWSNLTNGPFGISNIPSPHIAGLRFDTSTMIAAVALAATSAGLWLLSRLLAAPWGRALRAMRDDEVAARAVGKEVRRMKVEAFAISCGLAGLAGSVYASYVGYIHPRLASLETSILLLAMVIVGGSGNFRGPIVGAVVLLAIPEVLRFTEMPDSVAAEVRLLIYGLLLIAMMRFRPQGLAGSYRIG